MHKDLLFSTVCSQHLHVGVLLGACTDITCTNKSEISTGHALHASLDQQGSTGRHRVVCLEGCPSAQAAPAESGSYTRSEPMSSPAQAAVVRPIALPSRGGGHLQARQASELSLAEQVLCPAVVEDIRKKREAMSSQAGIYFITPTDSAVQRMLEDWDTRPQYKAAHIFFSSKVSGAQLQSIRNKPLLTQRLRSLKEVSSVADNANACCNTSMRCFCSRGKQCGERVVKRRRWR